MKTVGLIGGVSCESTIVYYKLFNELIRQKMGGYNSAKVLIYSVNFADIEYHHDHDGWDICAQIMGEAAQNLEKGGADFVLIGSNTMHKIAPEIQKQINIPVVHIADATIEKIKEKNLKKVAILGTKYSMNGDHLKEKYNAAGIEIMAPKGDDNKFVSDVVYKELCLGIINPESKKEYLEIIKRLHQDGAEGIILGCTEICLLVSQEDTDIPIFDTTFIHAEKAINLSLGL